MQMQREHFSLFCIASKTGAIFLSVFCIFEFFPRQPSKAAGTGHQPFTQVYNGPNMVGKNGEGTFCVSAKPPSIFCQIFDFQGVMSIRLIGDFYSTLGCHDMQIVL